MLTEYLTIQKWVVSQKLSHSIWIITSALTVSLTVSEDLSGMNLNSHGTRWLYPPRNEVAVYYQEVLAFSMLIGWNRHELCILVLKKSIRGLKMLFPVNFQFIHGEISAENFFLENFYSTKRFVFEFQGESF